MAKQGDKPKKSQLFKGPVRPVPDDVFDEQAESPNGQ
jgi:hypothetical protein